MRGQMKRFYTPGYISFTPSEILAVLEIVGEFLLTLRTILVISYSTTSEVIQEKGRHTLIFIYHR
jgi:hypothetical protein